MFRGLAPLTRKASPAWDPMEWWARHCKQLPLLSELAHKLLCIPATSASLKRVFFTAGLTAKRNRLFEDQAGRLVSPSGSWEAALSRAALAESTITSIVVTATTGSSSSTTAASESTSLSYLVTATGADNAAAGHVAAPASATDKRAAVIVAAASFTEGTHATGWSNCGIGRGAGVHTPSG
jgi:hAT family C-terminal dimerisation region